MLGSALCTLPWRGRRVVLTSGSGYDVMPGDQRGLCDSGVFSPMGQPCDISPRGGCSCRTLVVTRLSSGVFSPVGQPCDI